eukprot:1998690-Prymnesium_polylepis.1
MEHVPTTRALGGGLRVKVAYPSCEPPSRSRDSCHHPHAVRVTCQTMSAARRGTIPREERATGHPHLPRMRDRADERSQVGHFRDLPVLREFRHIDMRRTSEPAVPALHVPMSSLFG